MGWLLAPSMAAVTGPFLTHAGSNTYWYAVIVLNVRTRKRSIDRSQCRTGR